MPGAMLFADLEDQEGWNRVLVTFDSGAASDNVRLYLNGEEVGSADQGTPMESVGNIQFARQGSGINHYNGYLDETAIWDTALTGEEVASVYRNGKPVNVVVDYASYRSSMALSSFWRMGDISFRACRITITKSMATTAPASMCWASRRATRRIRTRRAPPELLQGDRLPTSRMECRPRSGCPGRRRQGL